MSNNEKVIKKALTFVLNCLILLHILISCLYNLKLYQNEILYTKAILVPLFLYLISSFLVISICYKNTIKIKFITIISCIESLSFFITWIIIFSS